MPQHDPANYHVRNDQSCPHRLAASHTIMRLGMALTKLGAKLLPKHHPARIFAIGRAHQVETKLLSSVMGRWHTFGITTLALLGVVILLAIVLPQVSSR